MRGEGEGNTAGTDASLGPASTSSTTCIPISVVTPNLAKGSTGLGESRRESTELPTPMDTTSQGIYCLC